MSIYHAYTSHCHCRNLHINLTTFPKLKHGILGKSCTQLSITNVVWIYCSFKFIYTSNCLQCNNRESLIQHCERSELCLHFELSGQKFIEKAKNVELLNLLVKQRYHICSFKLDKNCWKMPKFKCNILSIFKHCGTRETFSYQFLMVSNIF